MLFSRPLAPPRRYMGAVTYITRAKPVATGASSICGACFWEYADLKLSQQDHCGWCQSSVIRSLLPVPAKGIGLIVRANAFVVLLARVHAARRCPDKPAKAQASSVMARANKVSRELLHMRSRSRQSTTDLCAMQAGWI